LAVISVITLSCFAPNAAAWSEGFTTERGGQVIPGKTKPTSANASLKPTKARAPTENAKKIEEALQERFHDPGAIDGVIDERTRDALREFQRLNHLPVTGVVDEQTAAKLEGVEPERNK